MRGAWHAMPPPNAEGLLRPSNMSATIHSLANETLDTVSIYIPDRSSLGSFMNTSTRMWRIARRQLFHEFRAVPRLGEEHGFADAIAFLEAPQTVELAQHIRILSIVRKSLQTTINDGNHVSIDIVARLLAQTPNAHSLRVCGLYWDAPGCYLPLPRPNCGFATRLTTIHVELMRNQGEGPSVLCLMGLGSVTSLRITDCKWGTGYGPYPLRDATFIPRKLVIEGGLGPILPLDQYAHLPGHIEHLEILDMLGGPTNIGWLLKSIGALKDTLTTLHITVAVERGRSHTRTDTNTLLTNCRFPPIVRPHAQLRRARARPIATHQRHKLFDWHFTRFRAESTLAPSGAGALLASHARSMYTAVRENSSNQVTSRQHAPSVRRNFD